MLTGPFGDVLRHVFNMQRQDYKDIRCTVYVVRLIFNMQRQDYKDIRCTVHVVRLILTCSGKRIHADIRDSDIPYI